MKLERRDFNALVMKTALVAGFPEPLACSQDREIDVQAALPLLEFVNRIPKAESHIHLQGCVTQELLLKNGL